MTYIIVMFNKKGTNKKGHYVIYNQLYNIVYQKHKYFNNNVLLVYVPKYKIFMEQEIQIIHKYQ